MMTEIMYIEVKTDYNFKRQSELYVKLTRD